MKQKYVYLYTAFIYLIATCCFNLLLKEVISVMNINTCLQLIWTMYFKTISHFTNPPLSFLAEPHAGFRIAFNMFDTDGNEMVDRKEFLVVCIFLLNFYQ